MRGSVARKTDARGRNLYYVVIEEANPDGPRRRRWHSDPATGSGFTRKGAAEAYANQLLTAKASGGYVQPSTVTINEWADQWLQRAVDRLKPSTYASYEKNLRVHIRPAIGATKVQALTSRDLDDLYRELRRSGKQVKGKPRGPLAPRTVHYCHVIIKAMLKDAVKQGIVARNAADGATPPSSRPQTTAGTNWVAWSAQQLADFLDHTQEHDLGPLFAMLALTGMRRGEVLGVRWQRIDIDRQQVSIMSSVGRVKGKIIEGTPKTATARRMVALDPLVMKALDKQQRRQAEHRRLIGAGYEDNGLVFASIQGGFLNPERVSAVFKREVTRAGLPDIRLHDLRHTWATLALQAGIHPRVVQERLGHSTIAITLQTYSHVIPAMQHEAAATVANLVSASRSSDVTPLRVKSR